MLPMFTAIPETLTDLHRLGISASLAWAGDHDTDALY